MWQAAFFDEDDNRYDAFYDCSRARAYARVANMLRDTDYEFADVCEDGIYAFTVDKQGRMHFDEAEGSTTEWEF